MNRTRLSYVLMFCLILLFTFYISVSGYSETRLDTDPDANDSFWPTITSDNSGHVYATWQDFRNGARDIYFNYSSDYGATWQANDIRLDTSDAPGAKHSRWPTISCDNSGHVYVTWDDKRNGAFDIYFNYSSDYGASWSGDIRLDTDAAGAKKSLFPQIINDGSGNVYVAWTDKRNGKADIYFNYSDNYGASWQASDIRLDTGDAPGAKGSWIPEMSCDGSGNVYMAWEEYRNGSADIYFNYSNNYGASASWSGAIRLDNAPGATASWGAQISNDDSGNVYVAWEDHRNVGGGGKADVYFNYSDNYGTSTSWQASDIRLDTDVAGTSDSWYPEISSDGNGNVYVTWEEYRNGMSDIYFNYSDNYGTSTSWKTDKRLDVGDDPGTSDSWWPAISSNGSGYVYVTWYDERDGGADIYFYYSSDYGATWQASETRLDIGDAAGTSASLYPEIITDSNGNVYVTWHDNRNGLYDIYFDTLASANTNTNAINIGDDWKYFKGSTDPGELWYDFSFNDLGPGWLTGPTGIGFGDGDDATILTDMQYSYTTVYARKTFNVSDTAAVVSMRLRIDYDDGFVTYINGVEVMRVNMPGGTLAYNTNASAQHEAGTPVVFDLGAYTGELLTGTNVLAIEIHNRHKNNNDLSMIPELEIESSTAGDPLQTNNVIATEDSWNYFEGTSNPGAGWDAVSFDDSLWSVGQTGIGFGDGDDATVLLGMQGNYSSVYARKTFNLSDVSAITSMTLRMDYDDGFVAYINGVEVTRANMPGGTPNNNTNASGAHEAGTTETFDLSSYTGNLVASTNVLAIEIHNSAIGDDDLSMIPELDIINQIGGASLDVTSPTAPANLTATAVLSSQINLSWTASTDAVGVTGYKIFRDGGGTPIATTTGTTYQDTGLSSSTLYTYYVTARDAANNESAQSSQVSDTTFSLDVTAPSTPANLTATAVSSSQINLSWDESMDNIAVTGYNIYRDTTLIDTTLGTTYSDTGLSAGTPYTYNVSAEDAVNNESGQSASDSAITFAGDTTPPSVPGSLTATVASASQINLSWTGSTDAVGVTGYKIYRDSSLIDTIGVVTTYQDTGLNPGTPYTYNVTAIDAASNESAQSSPASDTTFTAADQAHIDFINDLGNTSEAVRAYIEANLPVSDPVYSALINRADPMLNSDLQWIYSQTVNPPSDNALIEIINAGLMLSTNYQAVLDAHATLSDAVLSAAISKATIMTSSDYRDALQNKSPLTEPVLDTLVNTEGIMTSLSYKNVLLANSPPSASRLPQSIIDQIAAGKPTTMSATHRQDVLDANP